MILPTVGSGGTNASPRGDSDEVVRIVDAKKNALATGLEG